MSQRKLRAACFDLDGTLIDTGPLHVQAEHLALKTLGIPEPAPDHPVTFGTGVMPGLETLAAHYGFDSAETVLNAYLPAWNSLFEDGLQQMPGADQVLQSMSAVGIPLALVTSGEDEYVDRVLARFDWANLFVERVTQESVSHLKPDPEPYLLAAEKLGIPAAECAGFEDSTSGLNALINAGFFSVMVGVENEEADMSLASLEELDAQLIESLFDPAH